jgi:tRNA dimethylallyltransferase
LAEVIVIAGPTASGKTEVSISLAQSLDAEIISCDSRQFYRKMDIGTAKPTVAEQAKVPHHFLDIKDPSESYNAGQFESDVIPFLKDYFKQKERIIMVGGSGLYIKAVLEGFDDLPTNPEIRNRWNLRLKDAGLTLLQEELKNSDLETYQRIDIMNPQRVIRALEVIEISGEKMSALQSQSSKQRDFTSRFFCLNPNRDNLYGRINDRVDHMIASGLIDEVKSLLPYRDSNALKTVGYNEILEWIDGKVSLEEAISAIKQHTRNYAKRQFTWFRKQKNVVHIDTDYSSEILRQL